MKNKLWLATSVGGVAVAGLIGAAVYATAEPEPPEPLNEVAEQKVACPPSALVQQGTMQVTKPGPDAPKEPGAALDAFLGRIYPETRSHPRDLLYDGTDLKRYGITEPTPAGTKLVVDVAQFDGRHVVVGWTGCSEYLEDARSSR
jgi:hypothetical protein